MNVIRPEPWTLDAVCASTDPELFYPEKGGSAQPAKRICAGCPVRITCAEFALTGGDPHGVYGGLSERDRRRLLAAGWQSGDALPDPPSQRMQRCTWAFTDIDEHGEYYCRQCGGNDVLPRAHFPGDLEMARAPRWAA